MGTQVQTPKASSKEGAGAQIQTFEVTSALVLHGSSSGSLMDVKGLVNQTLSELVATYITKAQVQPYLKRLPPLNLL